MTNHELQVFEAAYADARAQGCDEFASIDHAREAVKLSCLHLGLPAPEQEIMD